MYWNVIHTWLLWDFVALAFSFDGLADNEENTLSKYMKHVNECHIVYVVTWHWNRTHVDSIQPYVNKPILFMILNIIIFWVICLCRPKLSSFFFQVLLYFTFMPLKQLHTTSIWRECDPLWYDVKVDNLWKNTEKTFWLKYSFSCIGFEPMTL